jgi:hypothetical protein
VKLDYRTATDVYLVPVSNLKVDPDIQRKLDNRRASKMADEWDETLVGVLIGVLLDDTIYLTDGQHRAAAAQMKFGRRHALRVLVHAPATEAEGAHQFLGINSYRKAISKADDHRVAVKAGREDAMQINKILEDHGLEVGASPSANRVACVAAMYRVVHKNPAALSDAFATTISVWGRTKESYDADLIQAVAEVFLLNTGKVNVARLQKTLARQGVLMWKASAQGGSRSRSLPIAREIVRRYNSGLRGGTHRLAGPA